MDAPALPQDAADLLAIGRRYYEVTVEWVPKGDHRCYGRAFGFWNVRAGPPGWAVSEALRSQEPASPFPTCPGRNEGPATVQWVEPRETIRKALTMAREMWPECCAARGQGEGGKPGGG